MSASVTRRTRRGLVKDCVLNAQHNARVRADNRLLEIADKRRRDLALIIEAPNAQPEGYPSIKIKGRFP